MGTAPPLCIRPSIDKPRAGKSPGDLGDDRGGTGDSVSAFNATFLLCGNRFFPPPP